MQLIRRGLTWGLAVFATLGLVACGGSGPGAAGGGGGSSVSTLSAFPTRYNQLTTVTVSGSGLDQSIQLEPGPFCSDLTRVPGGSELSQSFSCRLWAIGEHRMRVTDANGRQLATLQVIVPAPQVTITTNKGAIVVELDVPSAPASVNNFLGYALGSTQFYAGTNAASRTIFHRAEAGVVIAGGGFTNSANNQPSPKTNPTPMIVNESFNGLKNLRGTISLVADPTSPLNTRAIFQINLKDNPQFDRVSDAKPGNAVFGRVVSGFDIAELIGNEPVQPFLDPEGGFVPKTPVTITATSQTR